MRERIVMEIVEKSLKEIKPYEHNPRNNEDSVQFVANSIKQFGFRVPIIIDKDNVIVAGHTRYLACQQLKMKTVPCVYADDLTPEQIKAYRIADNKTAERSTWDNDVLGEELKGLLDDFKMTDFGFGDFEISMLTEDFEPDSFDDIDYDKYQEASDNTLKGDRVIITYGKGEEDDVRKLLRIEGDIAVTYRIKDIMGRL